MYAYPIYLPEFSNREDLLLTVALFDDDTGDAIDMSGCTRAIAGAYTNNLWLVTDGPFVTISNSVLTIPDYPIGDELQAAPSRCRYCSSPVLPSRQTSTPLSMRA